MFKHSLYQQCTQMLLCHEDIEVLGKHWNRDVNSFFFSEIGIDPKEASAALSGIFGGAPYSVLWDFSAFGQGHQTPQGRFFLTQPTAFITYSNSVCIATSVALDLRESESLIVLGHWQLTTPTEKFKWSPLCSATVVFYHSMSSLWHPAEWICL